MKKTRLILIIVVFPALNSFAQFRGMDFSDVDRFVQTVSDDRPDSLAYKLSKPYSEDVKKVRAIFSWIAQHIAYNTGIFQSIKKHYPAKYGKDPLDSMAVWKSGEEMMAIRVLHRRVTVCEGYAKLFKVLCDYANLESVIIIGYAKGNPAHPGKFRSNHSWNAVRIDSQWYLVDPTWGAGFVNHRDEFVQQTNEDYFLSSPGQFIEDHYPEDLRWTLMSSIPPLRFYQYSPFRYRGFDKYTIDIGSIGSGWIYARMGDTVRLKLTVRSPERDQKISPDPFFDSSMIDSLPHSIFLSPEDRDNELHYSFIVKEDRIQWVHLFYNDDLVLRYRLKILDKKQN